MNNNEEYVCVPVEISAHTHEAWLRDMASEWLDTDRDNLDIPYIKSDGFVTCHIEVGILKTLLETSPDVEDAIRKLIGMKNN